LEKGDRLLVDGTYLALVSSCFPERDTQLNPNGQIDLSPSETTHLRYMMVRYINTLESILATWRHNVADREIIREEFGYLFDPKKGHHLLKEFRAVLGDDNYPAIRDFEADLKSNPLRVGKPQLGQ
jgi:hypothetical protein